MHTRIFFLSFILALLVAACGGQTKGELTDEQKSEQDKAYQQMMDVHDEAMAKIAEMNRTARDLKPYRDSLESEAQIEEVNLAIERLEGAEEAMMQWMASSPKMGQLRDTLNHEQVMTLLDAEQEKIDEIGAAMTRSLESAQTVLAGLREETQNKN